MPGINPEIIAGELLAQKIKDACFSDIGWSPKVAWRVGLKMSDFKHLTRGIFQELDQIQYLHRVGHFTVQDIRDTFDDFQSSAKEGTCRENQPNAIGALLGRSMAKVIS